MKITTHTPVGEIVKANFKAASAFQANRIDYCCGGHQSVLEACEKAGVKSEVLIKQLEEILQDSDPDTEYINNLELSVLADYIVNRHHSYVRKYIPFLTQSLQKIADVHGANHPELTEVRDHFLASAGELTKHMQNEELVLFPYVKQLEKAKKENKAKPVSAFGSVMNPIESMIQEHQNEGERFELMAQLTGNYRVPEDGCTTYEVSLKQLADFEKDLHRHIHLENNILFVKAKELEESFG
jgi:regulator of cell morphogenesis and NO signaling